MQSGAAAIESLMSQLRHEIVKLMYRHGRYFGLTMNVPCQPEWIGRRDLLLSLNNLVDEFNLHTVDLNDAESSALAAPQATLFAELGGMLVVSAVLALYSAVAVLEVGIRAGYSRHPPAPPAAVAAPPHTRPPDAPLPRGLPPSPGSSSRSTLRARRRRPPASRAPRPSPPPPSPRP